MIPVMAIYLYLIKKNYICVIIWLCSIWYFRIFIK